MDMQLKSMEDLLVFLIWVQLVVLFNRTFSEFSGSILSFKRICSNCHALIWLLKLYLRTLDTKPGLQIGWLGMRKPKRLSGLIIWSKILLRKKSKTKIYHKSKKMNSNWSFPTFLTLKPKKSSIRSLRNFRSKTQTIRTLFQSVTGLTLCSRPLWVQLVTKLLT